MSQEIKTDYWASEPKEGIASAIEEKFENYLKFLEMSGQAARIQESYNTYYGFNKPGGFGIDEQDEAISRITVPHYKNLLSRIHMMCCQAKLSFAPKALNSDASTQLQTDLAKGLLEYEMNDKDMGKYTSHMVEQALVMFGGFIYAPWDRSKGNPLAAGPDGNVIMTGDQAFHTLHSFDVARATTGKTNWYIIETKVNKYDLIAQYPKFRDIILGGTGDEVRNPRQLVTPYNNNALTNDDDFVVIKTLLHEKTPALPKGRVTVVCNSSTISDDDFFYPKMPVVEMRAGTILGEVMADSPGSSLIGLQNVLDRVYSAQITNVLNGCIANIYSPDPNTKFEQIRLGQTLITGSAPPVAVSLIGQSPEANNLINDIINQETLLSGLNNTAKGNPESSLKSGTSLSLILSTAIQYISGLQQNYAQATAELGTIVIKNLQAFCQEDRIAHFAGVANKGQARSFSAKEISSIDRITVELGNPVTQNVAGRMELLQMMLQNQVIKDPGKIDDFLRTGNWESLTEDKFNQSTYIREENEMLRRGKKPRVMISDNHPKHIAEALSILDSEEARNNPATVDAVLAHVQEHIDIWPTMPPAMAMALGIPPAPPPPMDPNQPPMPPQGEQGPPPSGPAPEGPGSPKVMGTNLPNDRGIPPEFADGYNDFAQTTAANPAAQPV